MARLQGRNVVNTAPLDGQVLKFNASLNRWEPSAEVNAANYLNVYSVNGQSIAAAPTALELSTLGQNNGWTVSGGTPTTLSPQASGRYLIQYEVPAIGSSGISQVVGFRVTNNGAPIAGSQRAFLNPAFETAFASGSFIAALASRRRCPARGHRSDR